MPGWSQSDLDAHNQRMVREGGALAVPLPAPAKAPRDQYRSKTEASRAIALELDRKAGLICRWEYEPVTIKLAPGVRYTPDFLVVARDGAVSFEEVKGRKGARFFSRPIGKMKVALAAKLQPQWKFRIIYPGARFGTWDQWEVPTT